MKIEKNIIPSETAHFCLICKQNTLYSINKYADLPRITSDCKPFNKGGKLKLCVSCGAIQKIPDEKWLREIDQIYANYQTYSIAHGEEQLVIDPQKGLPEKRSVILIRSMKEKYDMSTSNSIIDIGCGDGVTLDAISKLLPNTLLFGHELSTDKEHKLHNIFGFKKLFTCPLNQIDEKFDFITMVHALEHFPNPIETLKTLRKFCKNNTKLLIQVPNIEQNPFDLLIADHLIHLSPITLELLALQAGFDVSDIFTTWVNKEISLVAKPEQHLSPTDLKITNINHILEKTNADIIWLENLLITAKDLASTSKHFGIFGTSIAASWLASTLSSKFSFFVDEDKMRIGKIYFDKPIISPSDVPENATVLFVMSPIIASKIIDRLSMYKWKMISPTSSFCTYGSGSPHEKF